MARTRPVRVHRLPVSLVELAPDGTPVPGPELPSGPAPRAETTVQRIVRNSEVSRRVKQLHKHTCQVCGTRIEIAAGAYSEGAHIRPLGRPHDGPDIEGNILCLCPNDHVRFEFGAIVIDEDFGIRETASGANLGSLRTVRGHSVDRAELAYHRERFDLTA